MGGGGWGGGEWGATGRGRDRGLRKQCSHSEPLWPVEKALLW